MTVCSSQSEAQPGFVTLWFATYHSYTETDRTSVLKVVDPESGKHYSTTDFQSCRATNNNRNVDDIADVLQSSCSHISLYLDGAYRQAFPHNSSVACYQSGTTARLGEIRAGDDSLEVCYSGSTFNSWHAAIVKADSFDEHEVWIDGSPSNGAAPLAATWNSHESHMPCTMSSSVHWILPFPDLTTRCSSPPAHLLDHVLPGYDCSNYYAGQICSVECEPGYATQGVLQCENTNSTNDTGVGEWSSSFACVSYASDAPPTRAPGVKFICEEHNDLGDTETGNVTFQNYDNHHTECWHIECDKDVVISFSNLQLYSGTYLYLYSSGNNTGNGTDFALEKRFASWDSAMDVVLSGSAFVQFQSNYDAGWSRLSFNYVCVDATTPAPPTDVPPTRAPGVNYPCEEHNDLGDNETGNVSFQNYYYRTECWHIECDKDVVISFSTMQLSYQATLTLYTGDDSGNETDFTLEKSFSSYDYSTADVVLNGSAFVQFRSVSYWGWSRLEFNYICVDATTPAPPTDVPDTRAPGVIYFCEEHNDLGNNETGHVSFQNYDRYHTECWHIECDKDVVISFSTMQLYTYSYLYLYTGSESENGTDFDLQHSYRYNAGGPANDIVLHGSAFLQFRSGYYSGWSRLEFDYVCVDATSPAPPTDVPNTRAPGVNYVCEDHNDLGDAETGNVSFQNYERYHTECWHIECDRDVVISFSNLQLYYYSYLYLYTGSESENGTDFDQQRLYRYGQGTPDYDIVLHGSAFVQFRSTYYNGWSRLSFNYVCVDATTEAPPTDAPTTRAPGVQHVCEDHNDRTGTGYENLENTRSYYTHCWHIECDYDVVLKFSDLELYYYSYVSIYSSEYGSGNDTDFNLEHEWSSRTSGVEGVEIVVRGSAFVQFRSTYYNGRSYLAFQYECRAPTPPPQPHCGVADTVPQRCGRGTSRACAFEVRHPAGLLSVAFSWDGRRVATGSADRFVRVFDARTGVRVGQLGCADGFRVHDIAFSPDNNLVALAGEGGRVVVCDAATGVLEATLVDMSASESTPVRRVEFTKDGRYVVSGGGHDARTRVFDMHSSDRAKASSVINHHARNVGFSVDGAHLATVRGSEVDEVTTVWRLDGVASAVELPSVSARVTALSFSSFGGNALLRGMSDGTILVSQLPGSSIGDGSAVDGVSLRMLSGAVHDSKFSRDGKMIAAVGEGEVMVWSHDGSVLHELLGHSQAVLPRLDFSPDGTRLATVSRDGTLVVWKL